MALYYTEDVVAKVTWWFAVLAGILILVWSSVHPEALYIAVVQLAMLVIGKWMYPEQRLGRIEDNPIRSKSRNQTLIAIIIGIAAISITQILLLATFRFATFDLHNNVFGTYTLISAGIAESYFLHWGVQTNLSTYLHKFAGLIAVPILAVILHSAAYGQSGTALLIVAIGFFIFAFLFEYTKRLSVPIIVHMVVNLLG